MSRGDLVQGDSTVTCYDMLLLFDLAFLKFCHKRGGKLFYLLLTVNRG